VTPATSAACRAPTCARWSIAQASPRAPVREAMHETSASKRSPQKPSRASDAGSVTSPMLTKITSKSAAVFEPSTDLPRQHVDVRSKRRGGHTATTRARWCALSCRWHRLQKLSFDRILHLKHYCAVNLRTPVYLRLAPRSRKRPFPIRQEWTIAGSLITNKGQMQASKTLNLT
jgi:hypothetical protein